MSSFQSNLLPQWTSFSPTQVIFGNGSLDELGIVCRNYGKSVLLVSGDFAPTTGLSTQCTGIFQKTGIRYCEYCAINSDPTVHQINEITSIINNDKFKAIVALGGGSIMDAGKAASVVAVQGGSAEDYLTGKRVVKDKSLPVIAVPTTAGTGAELSKGAIVTWPERHIKGGIRGIAVFPDVAIVDPTLTLTLPVNQTKITGFDVFTHAVESYISRRATPITAMYSQEAIKAVCRFLPRVLQDPQNLSARTTLAYFSMLMGYNLANSSTCLPHRLQYPLGSLTNTPHALGLAALYPAWIKITHLASPQRFGNVAQWIAEGMDIQRQNTTQIIRELVSSFMERIELTPTLRDLDVDEEKCNQMAQMVSGSLDNDPWWQEGTNLSAIYQTALDPI